MKPRVVQNQEVYHKLEARDKRILLKITYKKKNEDYAFQKTEKQKLF